MTLDEKTGCHLWTAFQYDGGYGGTYWNRRKGRATRFLWEEVHGVKLTANDLICHHCDNPPCCNLDHLFLSTVQGNALDKVRKGRQPQSDLTCEQVLLIRKDPRPNLALALDYGISDKAISNIRLRRTWAWLDDSTARGKA